jgi:hypothetical protein
VEPPAVIEVRGVKVAEVLTHWAMP